MQAPQIAAHPSKVSVSSIVCDFQTPSPTGNLSLFYPGFPGAVSFCQLSLRARTCWSLKIWQWFLGAASKIAETLEQWAQGAVRVTGVERRPCRSALSIQDSFWAELLTTGNPLVYLEECRCVLLQYMTIFGVCIDLGTFCWMVWESC